MGLGLHIADEIMKMHGGRVAFADRNDITIPKEFTGAIVLLQFEEATK
jgi:nitrogen fixation/metabolism regulation signal transduction histidine kinase